MISIVKEQNKTNKIKGRENYFHCSLKENRYLESWAKKNGMTTDG